MRPDGPFAYIWATLNEVEGEPDYPTAESEANRLCARQNFERGYSLWFDDPQNPDRIWAAVTPNPAADSGSKAYNLADTWPGTPEYWCSAAQANAPLGPKRGFGKVWCENSNLRADIGQAVEVETGSPPCEAQDFQGGTIVYIPLDATYWVFINEEGWYRFDE